jgi:hypothetical protein
MHHANSLLGALQNLEGKDNVQEALHSAQEVVSRVGSFLQKLENKAKVDWYQDISSAPPQGHVNGHVSGGANNFFQNFNANAQQQQCPVRKDGMSQVDLNKLRNTIFQFMEEVSAAQQRQQQQHRGPHNHASFDLGQWSSNNSCGSYPKVLQSWGERKSYDGMPEYDGYPKAGCATFSRQPNGRDPPHVSNDNFALAAEIGMRQKCAEDSRNTYGNINSYSNVFGQKATLAPHSYVGRTDGFSRQNTCGSLPDYPASDFASCYGGFSRQTTLQQHEQVSHHMSMCMDFEDDELNTDSSQGGFSRRTSPYANFAQQEDAASKVKGINTSSTLQSSPTGTNGSLPDCSSTTYDCSSFSRQSTPYVVLSTNDEEKGEISPDSTVAGWNRQQSPQQTTNGHAATSRQTNHSSELQQDVQGCTKSLSEISSSLGLRLTVKSTFIDCDTLSDEDTLASRRLKRSASFQILSRIDDMAEEEIEDFTTAFAYRQVTC